MLKLQKMRWHSNLFYSRLQEPILYSKDCHFYRAVKTKRLAKYTKEKRKQTRRNTNQKRKRQETQNSSYAISWKETRQGSWKGVCKCFHFCRVVWDNCPSPSFSNILFFIIIIIGYLRTNTIWLRILQQNTSTAGNFDTVQFIHRQRNYRKIFSWRDICQKVKYIKQGLSPGLSTLGRALVGFEWFTHCLGCSIFYWSNVSFNVILALVWQP